jgi:hypothetical protein
LHNTSRVAAAVSPATWPLSLDSSKPVKNGQYNGIKNRCSQTMKIQNTKPRNFWTLLYKLPNSQICDWNQPEADRYSTLYQKISKTAVHSVLASATVQWFILLIISHNVQDYKT